MSTHDEMIDALKSAGYVVAEGADDVRALIRAAKGECNPTRLCSGFGVFPNGDHCKGCADCGSPPFGEQDGSFF